MIRRGLEDTPPAALDPASRKGVVLRTIAVLPTVLTLGNALCGFAAVFLASREAIYRQARAAAGVGVPGGVTEGAAAGGAWSPVTLACVFVFLAMLLDGLDGYVARITRSASDLGEQLDSMADMVSFGVAPAFIAVQLIGVETPFGGGPGDTYLNRLALVAGLIYVACAALRLARFNIELGSAEQPDHNDFKGMPTPGAAGTVCSLVLLHQHFIAQQAPLWADRTAAFALVPVMLLVALGMVSSLRYVHVINRYVRGQAAFGTVAKAVMLGLLLFVDLQATLAAALVIYALSAPVAAVWRKMRRRS